MNNNREEISQGDAGKGRHIIITQATIWARQINAITGDILPGKGTIRRRLGLLSMPNPLPFLISVRKTEKWSKKAGIPHTETNSTMLHETAGTG